MPTLTPRGFWDYALCALFISGILVSLFWLEARPSGGLSWADAALAVAIAGFLVFLIILARRREKASWITKPTWKVYLAMNLAALILLFGAMYADAYFLHHKEITAGRLRHDLPGFIIFSAAALWSSRRQSRAIRELLDRGNSTAIQ